MGKIIGIQFQENGKMYYFDSADVEVKTGDYVIVDTARGYDLGEVVMGAREIDEENWRAPLKKVIRLADEQDIQHGHEDAHSCDFEKQIDFHLPSQSRLRRASSPRGGAK